MRPITRRAAVVLGAVSLAAACESGDTPAARDSTSVGAGATAARTSDLQRPSCGVDARTPLAGGGIGPLQVGEPLGTVARACLIVRDTTVLASEGMRERVVLVDLLRDTVSAVVASDSIFRVHVRAPLFRTADSLGVGTRVADLRSRGGRTITGEGSVFVTLPSHCGLSFRLRGIKPGQGTRLEQVPDTTVVDEVLAFGCRAPAR